TAFHASPLLSTLKISRSPSSPYLPVSVLRCSIAGVSSGRKPYFRNTDSMVLKMYLRRSISTGEKSRLPLGTEGFWAMLLPAGVLCGGAAKVRARGRRRRLDRITGSRWDRAAARADKRKPSRSHAELNPQPSRSAGPTLRALTPAVPARVA